MLRRGLFVLSLMALVGAFGCTMVGPSIAFSGLPAAIIHSSTYTLTLTGSPGASSGLWTYTLSSNCGGTFTSTTTPNNGPANPITIGPTNASTVQVSFAVTNPKADLSVTKSDNPDPVGVGYTLTYTVTVGNVGTCTVTAKLTTASGRQATTSQNASVSAANVVLTDTLPNPVTVSSVPAACAVSFPTVTCNLGTIANGGSATVTIQVTPQAGAVPSITNTASVTGAITDSNAANNTATAVTTVTPVADLSVTKDDSPDPVNATQNLTYTVTVTNNGPSAATNVTLTDTLPAAVTFVSVTPGTPTCTYSAGPPSKVTCSWASIPAAGSQTVTIVVKPTGVALSLTNTVAVSATEFDPNTANNSDTETTTVNPAADLSVVKSDNPDPVNVGDNLTYTVTVTNHGPNVATGVTVTDTLPAKVNFVSASAGCTYNAGPHTVTCTIGTLSASISVTITVTPQPDAVPSVTNSVSVSATEFDPDTTNNSDTEETTVNPVADLSVTKSDSPDPVTYGQNVTYTVTVTNSGPNAATNVTLTDTLPANIAFVSASAGCTYNAGPHTVTCTWASIPASGNQTVTIVVQAKAVGIDLVVDDDAGTCAYTGVKTDTASVTATEHDPNTANNTASADTTINKNHSTIGAAIAAASAGQKIFVCPGTYNESLIITKALTITGAGIALVTINPTTTGYGIDISGGGSNVTLEQFTLNAGNSRNFMIHVSSVSNFTIQNAKLVGAGRLVQPGGQPLGGVDLIAVTTALIKNVEVQDVSRNGISFTNSTGVTVDTVNVHDTGVSTGWAGIAVYATSGTTSATFAGTSTVTNTPMGLYVEDLTGTTVNLALSGGITFSGQTVAPIVRLGLGTVPGLEATGPTASFAEALGLIARLTAPEFPTSPTNAGAAFFYTVAAAISAAVASPAPYPLYAVVYDLNLDEFFVGNGMVIQRAINAASSGGKVNVLAGTYTEQLSIAKSLTLAGAGAATTIVKAPPAASRTTYTIPESTATWDPIVFARGTGTSVISVSISGFTIDGQNNYGASTTCYVGVLYRNVKPGTISNNIVKDMGRDGTQTFGIFVYGDSNVTISSNQVSNYGRGGIGANGDAGSYLDPNAVIQGNTVIGPGAAAPQTWASNGIQIAWGATGEIKNNEVTGNGWPGAAWTGTGIIVLDSNNVVVQGNNVHDNESGIIVGGYYGTVSGLQVKGNTVNNNEWGVQVINGASNTVVEDNTITNQVYDGFDVWKYSWATSYPTGTEVHNNVIYNNGWDAAWTNVTVEVVDMESNWWGNSSGPYDAADDVSETTEVPPCTTSPASEINDDGLGDSVADTSTEAIDYCPWLDAAPFSVSIPIKPPSKPSVRSGDPSVVQPIE